MFGAGADVVVGVVVVDVGAELVVVVATGCVVVVATATSAFDTLVVSVDSTESDSTAGADGAVVVISEPVGSGVSGSTAVDPQAPRNTKQSAGAANHRIIRERSCINFVRFTRA